MFYTNNIYIFKDSCVYPDYLRLVTKDKNAVMVMDQRRRDSYWISGHYECFHDDEYKDEYFELHSKL